MADHLQDQQTQIGEIDQNETPPTTVSVAGNNAKPQKLITSASSDKNIDSRSTTDQPQHKNVNIESELVSGSKTELLCDKLSECDIKTDVTGRNSSHVHEGVWIAHANQQHDDDRDPVNGCEKYSSDQQQCVSSLREPIESVHSSSMLPSGESLTEILSIESKLNTKDDSHFSSCVASSVSTAKSSETVISAGQSPINTQPQCSDQPCGTQKMDKWHHCDSVGETREIDEDDQHQQHNSQSTNVDSEVILLNNVESADQTSNVNVGSEESVMVTRSLSLCSSSETTGVALKTQCLESRPIYPNVPYSPYSSPRSNRRRPPLRESRRISIEQSGSFLQLNQYKLMDQIGQGSYGLVKLAYSEEDSTHYAMKILSKRRLLRQVGLMKRGPKKSTSPLDRVYREIAVLKKLDHPNVVKLVEVLDDPVEDSLYMVFELVKQGEVLSVPTKNPLSEERAWSVFRDTLLGLEYLHYQRIIHADIKPGNLLLTECGRVKIADLGVCNEFIGENATMTNGSTAGTPAFRAPESLNVGQIIYCGKAADIWALGATLYALVYGNVPFVALSVPALYEQIKNDPLSFPENLKISDKLRNCIQSMLTKDPSQRITVPQLKEHSWVTADGLHILPNEEENCRLVQVNDDDINSVVRSIPKLDTLILIKTMLKKHSFGNPFSRGISGRAPQRGGSRLERFIRAGRSNSAPGSYNMIIDRQLSGDNILPALSEHSASNCTNEQSQ